ncbi:Protein of unknown function [Spirosomataceae bacterium TFI 002]|nr:Protein of unknown function [Spirosomataceae bacterium TFI 002]
MNLRLLAFTLLLGVTFQAQSQEIELKNLEDSLRVGWWDRSTQLSINFAQASFNDSWQGGGVNNIALGFLFNNKADFTKGKGKWSNDIQFQYGFLNNKGSGLRKSVDRLFMDSKYSRKLSDKWSWFAGANFISQFGGGYTYNDDNTRGKLISNIFAPGYLSEGVGVDYTPTKHFKLSLGGATMRQTFLANNEVFDNTVNADDKSYGVARGKKVLTELGFQAVAAYNKDILPNVNLTWRYQAFVAYAPETKPIDHNINLIVAAKVNKYLNVNFSLIGIYDDDAINKLQLSQGLAAGLAFNL